MSSPARINVHPAPGMRIRYPDGRIMPAGGAHVPHTRYWLRRLQYGDCLPGLAPTPKKTTKKASKAAALEG